MGNRGDKAGNICITTNSEVVKFYSVEELNTLLAHLNAYRNRRYKEYQPYYMLAILMANTGLRVSEALALTWDDITDTEIKVTKQLPRSGDLSKVETLKTAMSYRTISLPAELVAPLKEFKREQSKLILARPGFVRSSYNAVFQLPDGRYTTPGNFRHVLREVCKEHCLEYKGTHCFRHSHAVHLLEAGTSIKYVSVRLGHSSIKITADIYLAITQRIDQMELAKYEAYKQSN